MCFIVFTSLCWLQVDTQLFDLLSSNSDIDHPLCEECTDKLLNLMDDSLKRTQNQAKLYENLFKNDSDIISEELESLENELKNVGRSNKNFQEYEVENIYINNIPIG